jgi:hypothetical protein
MQRFLIASLIALLTAASIGPSFAGPHSGLRTDGYAGSGYVVAGRCAPPPDGCRQ